VPYTLIAKSLVYLPLSTQSITTFSKVEQNDWRASFESFWPRADRPRVQAKIEAIELVEVSLPY